MAVELSIVIPCYNAEKYIQLCINNLENQTFTDWEAIFVNDGSTDRTGQLLEELVRNDQYIVIHKENGGTSTTRNRGIEVANGKYITFLDVDDEIDPTMYEKLVSLIKNEQTDMGICGFFFKVENEMANETSYLEKKNYPNACYRTKEEIRSHLIELWDSEILYNVWNKIYRTDLIKERNIRYRVGHVYTEDRVFNRLYLENCNSIAVTEECLYYYVRERAGSTTEKYRDDYFEIRHKEYIELQEHFKQMNLWNIKAREYVCREFTERISGCIENIFHAENQLSEKEKKEKIRSIIFENDVIDAVKYANCRSKKMKILVWPIKNKKEYITYVMYKIVFMIRKRNPALFHKLKNKR